MSNPTDTTTSSQRLLALSKALMDIVTAATKHGFPDAEIALTLTMLMEGVMITRSNLVSAIARYVDAMPNESFMNTEWSRENSEMLLAKSDRTLAAFEALLTMPGILEKTDMIDPARMGKKGDA